MTGLTEEERDHLCDAVVDYTANHANSAPDRFDKYLLPAVERILADRLAAHEAREAELMAALEAGDACGAAGCRALADRDALADQVERVRALADRWADVLTECKQADPRWILDRSVTTLETARTELNAALDGDQP